MALAQLWRISTRTLRAFVRSWRSSSAMVSLSESVRRLQAGLLSFLSMRRIEARRKNASAFRLRFSQSLASLRQRLSHAMVAFGQHHKSADPIGTFDNLNVEMRQNFCKRL